MVTLPTYHICLICTAIKSPHQGGLSPQGANKAYVILLLYRKLHTSPNSQNGIFALLILRLVVGSDFFLDGLGKIQKNEVNVFWYFFEPIYLICSKFAATLVLRQITLKYID